MISKPNNKFNGINNTTTHTRTTVFLLFSFLKHRQCSSCVKLEWSCQLGESGHVLPSKAGSGLRTKAPVVACCLNNQAWWHMIVTASVTSSQGCWLFILHILNSIIIKMLLLLPGGLWFAVRGVWEWVRRLVLWQVDSLAGWWNSAWSAERYTAVCQQVCASFCTSY